MDEPTSEARALNVLEDLVGKMQVMIVMLQVMILQLEGYDVEKETWNLYVEALQGKKRKVDAFLNHVRARYFGEEKAYST